MEPEQRLFSVFLVEDSAIIRDRLHQLIDAEPGLRVIGSATGATSTIAELSTITPDAVIIDISLEEGDGFGVLEFVNGMPKKPLVIMLTNYTYMSYRVRGLSSGADYFFDKTTEFDSVITVLKKHASPIRQDAPTPRT